MNNQNTEPPYTSIYNSPPPTDPNQVNTPLNRNNFLLIIGLSVLVLALISGTIVTRNLNVVVPIQPTQTTHPTQSPTATPTATPLPLSEIKMDDWKSFVSKEYSYDYPSEWTNQYGHGEVNFRVWKNQIMGRSCTISEAPNKNYPIKNLKINIDGIGTNYVIWKGVDCDEFTKSEIFSSFDKGADNYAIVFGFNSGEEESAEKIFLQIIESFRFI